MADKIKVLIVDDIAETRENIKKLLQFEQDIDVVDMARTGKEGVQRAKEHRPHVILMDINMPDMDGIQATGLIVKEVPTAQIVIVSVQSDTDYLRRAMLAGARDFLSKPPAADELINTIRRLGEISLQREQQMAVAPPQMMGGVGRRGGVDGKIITVFSPKGGAGCTTLAANLAIALQNETTKVLVVDCNLQFPDVAIFFNLKSKYSLVSLIQAADEELSDEFLESVLVPHASGVKVLLGPPTPEDAEICTAPQLKKTLEKLRDHFHYVIVDTASVLRDVELSIFDVSDRVVLVATPDIPSLANAKKFFDLSEKLEYPAEKTFLVLNRLDKRSGIQPASVEEHLKHSVKGQVVVDEKTALTSINSGVPFITGPKNQPLAQSVMELAHKLREEFVPKETPAADKKATTKPRSLFDRR
jgi:pilus assembly protein CpaE